MSSNKVFYGMLLVGFLYGAESFQPNSFLPKSNNVMRGSNHQQSTPCRGGQNTHLKFSLVDALSAVDMFYQTSPYAAAALTVGAKSSVADVIAQKRDSKGGSKIQKRRNIAYIAYGALYLGMAQHFIYSALYPLLFGPGKGLRTVVAKVCFDNFVLSPLLCLPIGYLTKAVVYRYSFAEAMRRYWDDIRHNGLLTKFFRIWGPAQCLTFSVIPEHLRVSFVAAVSFFWLIILSSVSSNADATSETVQDNESTVKPKKMTKYLNGTPKGFSKSILKSYSSSQDAPNSNANVDDTPSSIQAKMGTTCSSHHAANGFVRGTLSTRNKLHVAATVQGLFR